MYLSEQLEAKWSPVLDHDGLNKIKDPYRRAVTAMILENQEKAMVATTSLHTIQFLFHWFVVRFLTYLLMISAAYSQ